MRKWGPPKKLTKEHVEYSKTEEYRLEMEARLRKESIEATARRKREAEEQRKKYEEDRRRQLERERKLLAVVKTVLPTAEEVTDLSEGCHHVQFFVSLSDAEPIKYKWLDDLAALFKTSKINFTSAEEGHAWSTWTYDENTPPTVRVFDVDPDLLAKLVGDEGAPCDLTL